MTADNIFLAACVIAGIIMLIYYIKRERKLFSVLFGALTGFAALMILNKYGGFIGADIPLNVFNVSGSAALGVPFVICLVILKHI